MGKKLIMALTGLFLITFLIVHVSGNLQLFAGDDGEAFNRYTKFMTTNKFIKITSYALYASILIHVIYAALLTRQNRAARPARYAVSAGGTNSSWSSRNMGVLGTIVLVFLVVHLQNFWYQMKFGTVPMVTYEGETYKNLYIMVMEAFKEWWIVGLYLLGMVGLGYHLSHGFESAFQTLGLNHKKYTPFLKNLGLLFSVVISILFATMPVYFFLKSLEIV